MPHGYADRLEDVPLAHTNVSDNVETKALTVAANKEKLNEMVEKFPDLFVNVQYNVTVYRNGAAKRNRVGPTEKLRMERRLSIWNICLRFLVKFFRLESSDHFLRYVAESLKVLYLTTMAVSTVLHEASELVKTGGKVDDILNKKYPADIMMASESARLNSINSNSLHITRRHYETLTRSGHSDGDSSDEVEKRDDTLPVGLLDNSVLDADLV